MAKVNLQFWISRVALGLAVHLVLLTVAAAAQDRNDAGDEDEAPGFLIVIFSPEIDSSRRTMAQGIVWKSFIEKMKKRTKKLSVINEVTINETSDRARAHELARWFDKFTVWLQFVYINNANQDIQYHAGGPATSELLALKYVVFAPASNDILSSGEVEQEQIPRSTFRNLSKGTTSPRRPRTGLPDGSSSTGPETTDIDTYKRVGETVANRTWNAVKK